MARSNDDFSRIDPSLFRAFMAAAETQNFTQAALNAAMTQSGISQHIAKLEEQLGTQLFTRTKKSVILTEQGKLLVRFVEQYLDAAAQLQISLKHDMVDLSGVVSYAMPEGCLLSPHLGQMLRKRLQKPNIDLKIDIQSNKVILQSLLEGKIDFGFITESVDINGLTMTPFCEEEFVLVAPADYMVERLDPQFIREAKFVVYPGLESCLSVWFKHFFPRGVAPRTESLHAGGSVNSIHGALRLVAGGVGVSILPLHCAGQLLNSKQYQVLSPDPKKPAAKSMIFLATLTGHAPTRRAQQVMDWFFAMHPEVDRS